jgi:hypothetical protein
MRIGRLGSVGLLSSLVIIAASPANAASASFGERLQQMIEGTVSPVLLLIGAASLAAGIYLMGKGLMKMVEASSDRGSATLGSAFLMLFSATLLIALPDAAGVGVTSIFGSNNFLGTNSLDQVQQALDTGPSGKASSLASYFSGAATVATPDDCLSSKEATVCMAKNLALNVAPIATIAVFLVAFVWGLWLFASSLLAVAKANPGQGMPPGIASKFIGSALLMNSPFLFQIMAATIFGGSLTTIDDQGLVEKSSLLSYSTSMSGALDRYEELVGYVFVILALFGAVAFVKGVFMLISAGEGNNKATYGHALVFIIAGVLLANSKASTCMALTTVGAQAYNGLGFCS